VVGEIERVYTIPLGKAYEKPRVKRIQRVMKLLRAFGARHMKVPVENVRISQAVNESLFVFSIKHLHAEFVQD